MKGTTKFVLGTGIACAVLGPATVAGLYVSLGTGVGQGAGVIVEDGIPATVGGFQQYEGGQTPGMFGQPAPGTAPVAPAPAG